MPTVQELESLMIRFLGDNSDLLRKLNQVEEALKHTAKTAATSLSAISNSFKSLGDSVVQSALSLVNLDGGMLAVSQRSVKLAAEAESLKIAFGVMTGSVELADKTIKDLYTFAAKTPFSVGEVIESSRKLLAAGVAAGDLVDTMRQLGDVAAGVDKPLNELVYTFGSIKSQGTAFTMDIREFANRGIPIWLALAKVMKLVSKETKTLGEEQQLRLRKMVEDGRISFAVVQEAFKEMTGKGGMFEGLTEKQAQSLKGMFSNLKDDLDNVLRNFGKDIADTLQLKEAMKSVSDFAKSFDSLNAEQKKTLITIGSIAIGLGVATTGFISLSASIALASAALSTLTAKAVLARAGIFGIQTAIAGLIAYAGYELIKEFGGLKAINDEIERGNKLAQQRSEMSSTKYDKLIESAKSINEIDKRSAFFNEKITATQKELTEAQERYNKAKAKADELISKHGLKSDLIFTNQVAVDFKHLPEVNESIQRTKDAAAAVSDLTKGVNALTKARQGEAHIGGIVLGNMKLYVDEITKLNQEIVKIGLSEDAAKLEDFRSKGMSDQQLANIKQALQLRRKTLNDPDIVSRIDEEKQREDVISKIKDTTQALKDEYEARLDITHAQKIEHLQNKLREIQRKEPIEGDFRYDAGRTQQIQNSIEYLKKAADYAKKVDDFTAVKKILDDIKTPLQKFNEDKAKLSDLFQRDQLTWEQYSTAMDKAENTFKDATKAAHDFKDALMGIDAVLKGSAESQARINAYKEMLKLPLGEQRDWRLLAPMPREKKGMGIPSDQDVNDAMRFLEKRERVKKRELDDAMGYLEERRTAPLPREILNPTQSLVPNALNAPPTKAEDAIIDLLTKLATYAQEGLQKEGVVIAPANLNN